MIGFIYAPIFVNLEIVMTDILFRLFEFYTCFACKNVIKIHCYVIHISFLQSIIPLFEFRSELNHIKGFFIVTLDSYTFI